MSQPADPTVAAYIAGFEGPARDALERMRAAIRAAAPEAEEAFAYKMPAYRLDGPLVYFAGYANHVGLYAMTGAPKAFATELAGYKTGKGSIQFPLDRPLPEDLIRRIVAFRIAENRDNAAAKAARKAAKKAARKAVKKTAAKPAKKPGK